LIGPCSLMSEEEEEDDEEEARNVMTTFSGLSNSA
jgi:hypothetical protein